MSFPEFDSPVCENGYRWWYIDAISDDGQNSLTIIVFVGSVFSPYYAWSRNRSPTSAEHHCAINVALYGTVNRWTMTERSANSIERTATRYRIGPSDVTLINNELVCNIDEVSVPLPRKVVGQIRVNLHGLTDSTLALDSNNLHFWRVLAPNTRITVGFKKPEIHWSGNAYVDTNFGYEPMGQAFKSWNWSRAHLENSDTVVQYDVKRRDGTHDLKTLSFAHNDCVELPGLTRHKALPKTRYWRIKQNTRLQSGEDITNLAVLEDTPFYSRNRFTTKIDGKHAVCIHESIDFDRLNKRWVQCLLPFRMPRRSSPNNAKSHFESTANISTANISTANIEK